MLQKGEGSVSESRTHKAEINNGLGFVSYYPRADRRGSPAPAPTSPSCPRHKAVENSLEIHIPPTPPLPAGRRGDRDRAGLLQSGSPASPMRSWAGRQKGRNTVSLQETHSDTPKSCAKAPLPPQRSLQEFTASSRP